MQAAPRHAHAPQLRCPITACRTGGAVPRSPGSELPSELVAKMPVGGQLCVGGQRAARQRGHSLQCRASEGVLHHSRQTTHTLADHSMVWQLYGSHWKRAQSHSRQCGQVAWRRWRGQVAARSARLTFFSVALNLRPPTLSIQPPLQQHSYPRPTVYIHGVRGALPTNAAK